MLIETNSKTFPTKYKLNDTEYAKGWNACIDSIMQQKDYKFNDYLNYAAEVIAKLFLLCAVPQEEQNKLFRRLQVGAGDYMGSGYAFIDAFNKLYEEYLYSVPDTLYGIIKDKIECIKNNKTSI